MIKESLIRSVQNKHKEDPYFPFSKTLAETLGYYYFPHGFRFKQKREIAAQVGLPVVMLYIYDNCITYGWDGIVSDLSQRKPTISDTLADPTCLFGQNAHRLFILGRIIDSITQSQLVAIYQALSQQFGENTFRRLQRRYQDCAIYAAETYMKDAFHSQWPTGRLLLDQAGKAFEDVMEKTILLLNEQSLNSTQSHTMVFNHTHTDVLCQAASVAYVESLSGYDTPLVSNIIARRSNQRSLSGR